MSNFYTSIIAVAAAAFSLSSANAQTVQVSKTGTVTSVQEAIAGFAGDINPAPNVIQITDSEVYDEAITVNIPVTIEGTGAAKPRLTVKANPNGREGSAGLVVNLPGSVTSDTVVLRNLAVLPSLTEAAAISAAVNVYNNNAFVFLDDVLITGNDGADQPISTDGVTNAGENASHKHFAGDVVVAGETDTGQVGDSVELLLRNTIITNNRGTGTRTDGVLLANDTATPGFRKLGIMDGCVISYLGLGTSGAAGNGITATGDVEINAANDRLILTGLTFGIVFDGNSPNQRLVRGVVIASNGQSGINEISSSGVRMTLEDSILANNTRYNYWAQGTLDSPITIRRSTIGNHTSSSYQIFRVEPDNPSEINIEDSIIMGNGSGSRSNVVWNQSASPISIANSAVVFSGNRSMFMEGFYLPQYVNKTNVTHQNPHFANIADPFSPNFYEVTSPYYFNLGSGSTALAGGSVYTGTPIGPVTDQIITVSKSGSPNFSTIQGAIDSLTIDQTKRYIIQVLDSSVYDEVIDIDVPVSLQGVGSERPVLAVQENPNGFERYGSTLGNQFEGNGGLVINLPDTLSTATVELKNLVIIPSMSGNAPIAGIINKANNFYLNVENVLVTGNDGSNAPVSSNGLAKVEQLPAHRYFIGFGAHMGSISYDRPEGDGCEVRLANSVFTHTTLLGSSSTDQVAVFKQGFNMPRVTAAPIQVAPVNGVARAGAYRNLIIEDGCVFSYNVNGFKAYTNMHLNAPNARALFLGNQADGLSLEAWHENHINGLISVQNGKNGFADNSNVGRRPVVKNAIVADNGWYNLYMYNGTAAQSPSYYMNVTTANQSTSPTSQANLMTIQVSGASSGGSTFMNVILKDSIIAGHGDTTKSLNVISMDAELGGTLTIDHTAIVQAGDHALNTPPYLLAALFTVSGEAATTADPMFLNTVDPTAPNFYAVSNAEYGALSSTGGPLVGGGNFAPASVSDWSVY